MLGWAAVILGIVAIVVGLTGFAELPGTVPVH
jgi:hypothetical protein